MLNRKNNRRNNGSTLLELTIVIALMDIIAVLVISFCAVIENLSVKVTYEADTQSDYDIVETVLRTWVSSFDNTNYYLYVSEDNSSLIAKQELESVDYQFTFFKEYETILYTIVAENTNKKEYFFKALEETESFSFELKYNSETESILVICNITFTKKVQIPESPYHKTITYSTHAAKYGGVR